MQPENRRFKLDMPQDPSATYSNTVMISHNKSEVFFDFIQIVPHDPRPRVQRRIVMSPVHAKMFMQALQENMKRFEAQFGEVELPQRPPSLADQLFQGVTPPTDGDNEGGENE
jgi:hypothetical protein